MLLSRWFWRRRVRQQALLGGDIFEAFPELAHAVAALVEGAEAFDPPVHPTGIVILIVGADACAL